MDEQILQLLVVGDTPQAQQHILAYFEQLKTDDQGWQICGNVLAQNLYPDERIKFFCLQILEAHIKSRYAKLTNEHKQQFKSFLQAWYKQCCEIEHKNFIRNKTSQLFVLIFVEEYPQRWPLFFTDMLSLLEKGELAVDIYLRVLIAIDEEVVVRCIPHTPEEFKRNTDIKDHMRDHCINDLVESWYTILKLYEQHNPNIVGLCLKVIGAYISWIDINLIANDRFVGTILSYLNNEDIRESACECLLEIINKGMNASGKTALVQSLSTALTKHNILLIETEDDNVDFMVKLSSLINGMGIQLITSLSKLTPEETTNGLKVTILQAIEEKVPQMLRFLGDDDDDVSESIFEFCHSYLGLLKQLNGAGVENCRKHVKSLLTVIIKKMKYDEEFNFKSEGDSEAEFVEFRKQMKVLLCNLAKLDGNNVLSAIFEIFSGTLENWQSLKLHDVEVVIYILYCLGEAFPGQMLYTDTSKAAIFQRMMTLLITSNVSQHQHSEVKLQYFETVTRYERFFYAETQHIPSVLASFLDQRGLRNSDKSVSSRTSFLLMRFVKSLKNQIQPYVEDILKQLQELLVSGEKQNGYFMNLSENDRYYLYEVAAVLITCSNAPQEKQLSLMETLLSPIMIIFQKTLDQLSTGYSQMDPLECQDLAYKLHHLMAYTSRASKAFSTAQSLKVSGCASCFKEALSIFLHSLTIPVHREIIHTAVRQYLHRMIICLHDQVLTFIPVAVTHLLKDCEMRDIQEFVPLINQLITRFQGDIAPFLSEILMPLVTKIFSFIQAPVEANDLQALKEKQLLQRSYFLFISTIVNTNILQVLTNQNSSCVNDILLSIVHGAVEINDPQAQKTCFLIFHKLVEHWGSEESFKEFIYDQILPACFMAPTKPYFDLNDAQTTFNVLIDPYLTDFFTNLIHSKVLQEISYTQKAALQKRGLEVIQWLEQSYLPQNNCPPELIQAYSHALQTATPKVFKNFLKDFYTQAKT